MGWWDPGLAAGARCASDATRASSGGRRPTAMQPGGGVLLRAPRRRWPAPARRTRPPARGRAG
eukprot:3146580-Prymnesium_polylepis.1